MITISGILYSVAILSIVGAGLSTIVGARPLQAFFARVAICTIVLGLSMPLARHIMMLVCGTIVDTIGGTSWSLTAFAIVVLVVIGHIALFIALRSRAQRNLRADDAAQIRGRRRARLTLNGEER